MPLFAITNFSGEFFPPFRATQVRLFDRFRDIVVSGDEKLVKPDAAIYRLALERFGIEAAGRGVHRRQPAQCGRRARGRDDGAAFYGRADIARSAAGAGVAGLTPVTLTLRRLRRLSLSQWEREGARRRRRWEG